jgi:hypothetical protein
MKIYKVDYTKGAKLGTYNRDGDFTLESHTGKKLELVEIYYARRIHYKGVRFAGSKSHILSLSRKPNL